MSGFTLSLGTAVRVLILRWELPHVAGSAGLSSSAALGRFLSSSTQDCLTKTPLYASEVLVAPPADD